MLYRARELGPDHVLDHPPPSPHLKLSVGDSCTVLGERYAVRTALPSVTNRTHAAPVEVRGSTGSRITIRSNLMIHGRSQQLGMISWDCIRGYKGHKTSDANASRNKVNRELEDKLFGIWLTNVSFYVTAIANHS